MERLETFVVRNINFLTVEEKRRLRDHAAEFGKESARGGIPIVTANLDKLLDLAKNEKTTSYAPADFLKSASVHLWEFKTDIEDIFALYKICFQFNPDNAETIAEFDAISELQISFVNLAGKLTTVEEDAVVQKHLLEKSIVFINKNTDSPRFKVDLQMYYGKYLFEHGMEKEGRVIIQTTAKIAPKSVSSQLDLIAILEQVRED